MTTLTTTPSSSTSARRTSTSTRVGVVLATLQGIGCVWLGITQVSPNGFGLIVAIVVLVAGVAALALAVPTWRGVRWAGLVAGSLLLLQSLTGLPAFFFPDVSYGWQIAAAVGIVLAVVTLVLLARPTRR